MREKEHSFLMRIREGELYRAEVALLEAELACGVISLPQMLDAIKELEREALGIEGE